MNMIEVEFQRAVSEYLQRSGMSGRKLGELALGDPNFLPGLKRGSSPGLDAVDQILRFMEIAPIGPRFRREVEAFLIVTRIRPTLLGTRAIESSSFARQLRSGASPTLDIVVRVRSWMHGTADEFQRLGIAWLLANDVTVPPYGLGAAFAPWTDEDEGISRLDGSTFLTEREAAAAVGLAYQTLSRYRVTGDGPAFHKFGSRVLYARYDLEAWSKGRHRRKRLGVT